MKHSVISCIPVFLFFCICCVSAKKCSGKGEGGIIGGTKATRGQLPWQIYIYNKDQGILCGGSIISPRHVLTAGHCIVNANKAKADPSKIEIYGGVLNIQNLGNKDVQKVPVKAIHTDDKRWNPEKTQYELTILTLSSNFTWTDTVKPIRYATKGDSTDLVGQEVIASGWGTTDHYGNDGARTKDLLWTKMTVSKCEKYFGVDDLFCARGAKGENVCSGDSGGPIVCKDTTGKDYLCGFTSGGECEKGQSQLGRVNYYNDLLKEAMSKP